VILSFLTLDSELKLDGSDFVSMGGLVFMYKNCGYTLGYRKMRDGTVNEIGPEAKIYCEVKCVNRTIRLTYVNYKFSMSPRFLEQPGLEAFTSPHHPGDRGNN
jgi:hypothetical protein